LPIIYYAYSAGPVAVSAPKTHQEQFADIFLAATETTIRQ